MQMSRKLKYRLLLYSCHLLHAALIDALSGGELEKALVVMGQVLLCCALSAAATAAVELV